MTTFDITELEAQRTIALESMILPNAFERLTSLLPIAVKSFQSMMGLMSTDAPAANPLTSAQAKFTKTVANRNYLNLSQMPARVPEGMKGTYLAYLHILSEASTHASQIVDKLSAYTLFLGTLINEHGAELNTKFNRSMYSGMAAERDDRTRMLGTVHQPGSTKADTVYSAVVERNADWQAIFEALNLVTSQINGVNKRTINKKVEEASHYLQIIETKVSRGELAHISPQMVAELADGAFQMGKEVEYFVAIWYKVQAITEAINATVTTLNSVYEER
jgi:hypothetical protein